MTRPGAAPVPDDKPKRILPPFVFLAALVVMGALHHWLPGPEVVPAPWNRLGWAPFALALALAFYVKFKFDRLGTPIRPYEESKVLVTDGPYRWSRNPIYAGMVAALLGVWMVLGTLSSIVVVPAFAWIIQSRFIAIEEKMLEETFGADYRAYKARVRRWL